MTDLTVATPTQLIELLRKLDEKLNVPQSLLADLVGVHRVTLNGWLQGRSIPKREGEVEKVRRILELNKELLRGVVG